MAEGDIGDLSGLGKAVAASADAVKHVSLSEQGQYMLRQFFDMLTYPIRESNARKTQAVLDVAQEGEQKREIRRLQHEAYVARLEAEAGAIDQFSLAVGENLPDQLLERAKARIVSDIFHEQLNHEAVLGQTIGKIDERETEVQEIDRDWLRTFSKLSGKSSDPDVQDRWAEVLAREAAEPGSVSTSAASLKFVPTSVTVRGPVHAPRERKRVWRDVNKSPRYLSSCVMMSRSG